jgi:hypothetical protein
MAEAARLALAEAGEAPNSAALDRAAFDALAQPDRAALSLPWVHMHEAVEAARARFAAARAEASAFVLGLDARGDAACAALAVAQAREALRVADPVRLAALDLAALRDGSASLAEASIPDLPAGLSPKAAPRS